MPAALFRRVRIAIIACAVATCSGAVAEGRRAPAVLAALPFSARNTGPEPMACMAETAHFYSVDLGTARQGSTITQAFHTAPDTGETFIRNARGDLMPVVALWCGIAKRAWVTRFAVPLPRRTGRHPPPLRFACRSEAVALRCDAIGP